MRSPVASAARELLAARHASAAAAVCLDAIAAGENRTEVRCALARALILLGRDREAEAWLRPTLRRAPTPEGLRVLVMLALARGDTRAAALFARDARRLERAFGAHPRFALGTRSDANAS